MEQARIFTTEREFLEMFHGLCWERMDSWGKVVCTEPKGHKGDHCCTFATLDRYHDLRLRLPK